MAKVNRNQMQVSFVLDKQEHKTIKAKAKELGMTLAGYIKFVALNADVKVSLNNSDKGS